MKARDFPSGSDGKESASNAGNPVSITGSGRSPGEGNGFPLQCSGLESSMGRGAWWATVHKGSDTTSEGTRSRYSGGENNEFGREKMHGTVIRGSIS